MKVLIMRGLPGSGKSTYLKCNVLSGFQGADCVVCSADDYHMKDGKYQFNPTNVGKAHDACLEKFLNTILDVARDRGTQKFADYLGVPYLIVDNTNTSVWEIAPYYRLAELHGIPVQILRFEIDPWAACKRNQHQVPAERIFRMYDTLRTERLPSHWIEKVILSVE